MTESFALSATNESIGPVADYKHTLNLPQTDFPMKANLAQREPEALKHWQSIDLYRKLREQGRAATLRAARRSALCERRDPHRSCGEQDAQGHHRQEQNTIRFRCALCARLGLPWPAHRVDGREENRQGRTQSRSRARSAKPAATMRPTRCKARGWIFSVSV